MYEKLGVKVAVVLHAVANVVVEDSEQQLAAAFHHDHWVKYFSSLSLATACGRMTDPEFFRMAVLRQLMG